MRVRLTGLFFVILATGLSVFAQSRTVTNADLEKYRQERLKAEREYRENYERLGMPSPEELERQREKSRIETEQLADKLRREATERERLEIQQYAMRRQPYSVGRAYDNYPYAGSWPEFYRIGAVRINRFTGRQPYIQPGYFAGGQFWPTGSRTPSRPIVRSVPRR